jgi:uncharacterized protein (DUF2336 family)
MMNGQRDLIDELEDAFARHDIGRRAETLQRVTDLFVSAAAKYSPEQIALFDEVMSRLVAQIETSARAAFGRRLATIPDAPPNLIRALALDDTIEVAEPVLLHSERLDDMTLVESALTKSPDHLMAISRRKTLPEPVTDVLVDRGDHDVALSVAKNRGAKFSEFGYSTLVRRSQEDDGLALTVWLRPETPRQHMLQLFARASQSVRATLEAADPRKGGLIRAMVANASDEIQSKVRNTDSGYASARASVEALHAAGGLGEAQLAAFARAGKFDETAIALSIMTDLSIGVIERAMVNDRPEQIFVLAKAIGLAWETTEAILLLQAGPESKLPRDLLACRATFARLQVVTATKAIQFYRLREQAAGSRSG